MAEKRGVTTSLRVVFSLVLGIILGFFMLGSFILFPDNVQSLLAMILFLALPAASYLLSFAFNLLNQYIACGSVSVPQIAFVSALTPGLVLITSSLTYFVTFTRSLVEAALPATADFNMKRAFGYAFYAFWAGMYAQNLSSGLVQSCPGAAGPK